MYRCFPSRFTPLPHANGTADDAYQRTMDRESTLRARGYTIRSIWECEMKQQIRESDEMKLYFKVLVNYKYSLFSQSCDIHDPMGSRDGFYGGRTNAVCLYHQCTGTEKIFYVDVCSLCK
jgi:hypothetical protein